MTRRETKILVPTNKFYREFRNGLYADCVNMTFQYGGLCSNGMYRFYLQMPIFEGLDHQPLRYTAEQQVFDIEESELKTMLEESTVKIVVV